MEFSEIWFFMSILRQSSESVLFLSAISDQYRSISNIQLKSFVYYTHIIHLLPTLLYWLHSPCFKTLILNRWFMFANTFTYPFCRVDIPQNPPPKGYICVSIVSLLNVHVFKASQSNHVKSPTFPNTFILLVLNAGNFRE